MITREQAMTTREFHVQVGARCYTWRRNGQTQTWKRRPNDFRVPVKYGMYSYDAITQDDMLRDDIHTAEDCPIRKR